MDMISRMLAFVTALCVASVAIASERPETDPTPVGSPGTWISTADYPIDALLNWKEGITAFKLTVDANGAPSNCEIVTSSDYQPLDDRTCGLLMQRARFRPGTDSNGKATTSTYASRVRWVIPAGMGESGDHSRMMTVLAEVTSSGVVDRCFIAQKDEDIFKAVKDPCSGLIGTQILTSNPNIKYNRLRMRIQQSVDFQLVE